VTQVGTDVRRVSVHADGRTVDMVLPAGVPIAELLPVVVDVVDARHAADSVAVLPVCYQLSRPGASAFGSSTTLGDHDIRDGTLLMLSRRATELPAPAFHDAAEAVSVMLADVTRPWTRQHGRLVGGVAAVWVAGLGAAVMLRSSPCPSVVAGATIGCLALSAAVLAHRVYREPVAGLTLGLIAVGFAACAGFLAVPDGSGPPNVLLAATAAGALAVLTSRLTGCGARTFGAVSCAALVIAVAAAASSVMAFTMLRLGLLSTLCSLALLETSGRLSVAWSGLSPQVSDGPNVVASIKLRDRAFRADRLHISLAAGCAAAAAAGAICTVAGAEPQSGAHLGAASFAAVTGTVLLLRARSHPDLIRTSALSVAAMAALSAAVTVTGAPPHHAVWEVAFVALPVAVALCLGFVMPSLQFSPGARRGVDVLEYLGLTALVPLACWTCGLYSAARGVRLS
jgi:type VII secretion integral membrane protein EccD